MRHFDAIVSGTLEAVEQDETAATYAAKISRQDARLDWQRPAEELHRQVRAYNPVPGAYFMLDDKPIKCWRAAVAAGAAGTCAGRGLAAGRDGIVVACGGDALRLDRLQRPGKRPVTAGEFAASCVGRSAADERQHTPPGRTAAGDGSAGRRCRRHSGPIARRGLAEHEGRVGKQDRALLRLLCYGTLRHHWHLQVWIGRLLDRPLKPKDSVINALLAVGLYQLTETRIPDHAVVSQTVEASRLLRRPKLAAWSTP